jgi:alpha-glucosidase
MYRQALSLRREHALGSGRLDWRELGERALGFVNGDILVVANIDGPPARLPAGYRPLLSSGPAEVGDVVATDTTVWAVAVPGGRG